jgi:hypothetical protein
MESGCVSDNNKKYKRKIEITEILLKIPGAERHVREEAPTPNYGTRCARACKLPT